jgi:hypothetical protein
MTRERIVRAVLRVYPQAVRQAHGDEMLSTLLDSSDGSPRAFIREIYELIRAGLRSRSRAIADARLRRLVADGLCLAGVLWMAISICTMFRFRSPHWQFWLLATALSFALVGYDRIAGGLALGQIALVVVITASQLHNLGAMPFAVGWHVGPAAFFLVMVFAPRRRTHHLRSLIWLIPLAAVAYASSLSPGALDMTSISFFAVSLAGLASLPTDPRLAIAAASVWTSIGITHALAFAFAGGLEASPIWVTLAAAGPIVIVLAAARARYVRQNVTA